MPKLGLAPVDMDRSAEDSIRYIPLAKAYCLGEKYQARAFKNAILKEVISRSQLKDSRGRSYYPSGRTIHFIYEGTTSGSPARKLVVDMWICTMTSRKLRERPYPMDFIVELAARLLDEHTGKLPVYPDAYDEEE